MSTDSQRLNKSMSQVRITRVGAMSLEVSGTEFLSCMGMLWLFTCYYGMFGQGGENILLIVSVWMDNRLIGLAESDN